MNFLNLKAVLSLNGSGFALGLKRAESASKQFAKEIKGQFAQAFGAAAITAYGVKIINMADNIIDLSERLGVSTKALQEWNYAAQKSGSSIERVTQFLEHLARVRERALGGDKDAVENLTSLGVTDLNQGVDPMARQIGRTIASGNFSRVALAAVGGKGAGELVPALQAMDELSESAHKAGRVLNDETLEALKALKNEAMALSDVFSGPFAKSILWMAEKLRGAFTVIKAGIAGGAAFLGAGTAGISDSNKPAMDAAMAAFDEVFDEWENHQKNIKKQAEERARKQEEIDANQKGVFGPTMEELSPEKLTSAVPIKKAAELAAQSSINSPSLTAWQSAGAAIRFSPDKKALDDIAKHTRETAMNTRPTNKQAGSGIGGLGAELQ
jgi:hypothetical protein